jgi:DNA-binding GntR family transcriptional regulator
MPSDGRRLRWMYASRREAARRDGDQISCYAATHLGHVASHEEADIETRARGATDERLDRRSSGEQAARHLRRLIFEGVLRRGDRVPQDDIAANLGISRIPVREAIIALEHEGWLTIEPHRGAFVNGLDEAGVRDHYELFGLSYGLMAQRATERGTEEEFAQIAEAQRQLRGTRDPGEFFKRNDRFLRLLFASANTPRVVSHLQVMASLVPGNFFAAVPGSMTNQERGTAKIVRAMRRRDAEGASAECLFMLRHTGDRVVALLSDRGVFADPTPARGTASPKPA